MENTRPTGLAELQSSVGPALSNCARLPSRVPSLTEIDESNSSEGSRDEWWHDSCGQSSRSLSNFSSSMSQPPTKPSQPMIEISPGVHVRLRGADETWKAIEQDYYMPAECMCCDTTIFCIQNADFVLCPDCRVVSRMEGSSSQGMGGVGLGFKYEDLARWQADIIRKNARQTESQGAISRPRAA